MADREIRKRQFKTVQTDTEELNKKIRAHRIKIVKITLFITALLVLATGAVLLFFRLKEYTEYEVLESVERTDTVATKYVSFKDGVIKYSNDGAIYTNNSDEMIWNQTYEMQEPMVDICEDYVVFGGKGREKYLYFKLGETAGEYRDDYGHCQRTCGKSRDDGCIDAKGRHKLYPTV